MLGLETPTLVFCCQKYPVECFCKWICTKLQMTMANKKGDYVINFLSKIMNGMEIHNLQNCFQYITLSICLCILAEIFQALSLQGNFMNINSVGEWLIRHFCSVIASTLMLKIATWKHVILEPISESIRWSNLFVWSSLVTELWSSGSSFWHFNWKSY